MNHERYGLSYQQLSCHHMEPQDKAQMEESGAQRCVTLSKSMKTLQHLDSFFSKTLQHLDSFFFFMGANKIFLFAQTIVNFLMLTAEVQHTTRASIFSLYHVGGMV